MKKINATTQLKETIMAKESEQAYALVSLKNEFAVLKERIKPMNLLKNSMSKIVTPASILDASLGIATGYLSKKVIVRSSHNPLIKVAGSLLQLGVSALVMKNPAAIKSIGEKILNSIFRKKTVNAMEN